jgi:hypothetical protein
MKMKILTLSLVAVLAACTQAPANNLAGNQAAAPPVAGNSTGLPLPPDRSATAQTAMPAGLDCVRNRLTPEQRHGAAEVAMEQGSRDDPRARPLVEAVDACGEELSWSPQKRRLAGMFSLSAAGAAGLRELLGGRGVRLEELDRTILGDNELMSAAANGRLDSTAGQAFAARHLDELQRIAGGQELEGELGMRIGNYIAFRALAETLAAQFGRES